VTARRNIETATRAEIEEFLYREADLLDAWKLDEWLALLTEDCGWFVPPNDRPDADHRSTLFLVADDHARLVERVERLKNPGAHAEYPHSRTRRFISNVRVTAIEGDTVHAAANFIVHRFRRNDDVRQYVGSYRHKLRRAGGGLKLAERRTILDGEELGALGTLSFIL